MRLAGLIGHPASRGSLVGLLCGLAAWLASTHPILRGGEEWCQDASFAYRGVRPTGLRVAVVALDEPSLRSIPKPMAFASEELARVVTYLLDRKAEAVGLDAMIPEDLREVRALSAGDEPSDLVAAVINFESLGALDEAL